MIPIFTALHLSSEGARLVRHLFLPPAGIPFLLRVRTFARLFSLLSLRRAVGIFTAHHKLLFFRAFDPIVFHLLFLLVALGGNLLALLLPRIFLRISHLHDTSPLFGPFFAGLVFTLPAFELGLLPFEALKSFKLYVLSGLFLGLLQFGFATLGVRINFDLPRIFLLWPFGLPVFGSYTRMVVIEGLIGINAPVAGVLVPFLFRELLLTRQCNLPQSLFFSDLLVRQVQWLVTRIAHHRTVSEGHGGEDALE